MRLDSWVDKMVRQGLQREIEKNCETLIKNKEALEEAKVEVSLILWRIFSKILLELSNE